VLFMLFDLDCVFVIIINILVDVVDAVDVADDDDDANEDNCADHFSTDVTDVWSGASDLG
jgi:hypothetical protein